jgi:hypothetical protein
MAKRMERKKKPNGPSGIRTGVWLLAFCAVLACLIAIRLPPRHPGKLTSVPATQSRPDRDSSTRRISFRRTSSMEVTSVASESGASDDLVEAQLTMIEQATQDRGTWLDSPHRLRANRFESTPAQSAAP